MSAIKPEGNARKSGVPTRFHEQASQLRKIGVASTIADNDAKPQYGPGLTML